MVPPNGVAWQTSFSPSAGERSHIVIAKRELAGIDLYEIGSRSHSFHLKDWIGQVSHCELPGPTAMMHPYLLSCRGGLYDV